MNYFPASPIRMDDDLIAAALAAIHLYLEAEQSEALEMKPPRSAWQVAALVAAQGGVPARGDRAVTWRTVDRAGRAARWSVGILGTFD
ncbi:hypothetical protein [Roseiflexus castenholzii]|jgi:hypothetical protein|uniref:Uncharacterized protein n=1 Tax=Roseiflexus castenholzii (strain DSM 13941 / HLO8) TaxID=383372 RepID=A7NRX0_ROSCS|nr:hypothetical protein [Roseiflexus castenholzii]ABU60316.1 conserved hypothetical protein [Roseiflexus castenholzii DSM 13941]